VRRIGHAALREYRITRGVKENLWQFLFRASIFFKMVLQFYGIAFLQQRIKMAANKSGGNPVKRTNVGTREKIINTAIILFSDKGYSKTSVRDMRKK